MPTPEPAFACEVETAPTAARTRNPSLPSGAFHGLEQRSRSSGRLRLGFEVGSVWIPRIVDRQSSMRIVAATDRRASYIPPSGVRPNAKVLLLLMKSANYGDRIRSLVGRRLLVPCHARPHPRSSAIDVVTNDDRIHESR